MISIITTYTIVDDITGEKFVGSFSTATSAVAAAVAAGWMRIGNLMVSPTTQQKIPGIVTISNQPAQNGV